MIRGETDETMRLTGSNHQKTRDQSGRDRPNPVPGSLTQGSSEVPRARRRGNLVVEDLSTGLHFDERLAPEPGRNIEAEVKEKVNRENHVPAVGTAIPSPELANSGSDLDIIQDLLQEWTTVLDREE